MPFQAKPTLLLPSIAPCLPPSLSEKEDTHSASAPLLRPKASQCLERAHSDCGLCLSILQPVQEGCCVKHHPLCFKNDAIAKTLGPELPLRVVLSGFLSPALFFFAGHLILSGAGSAWGFPKRPQDAWEYCRGRGGRALHSAAAFMLCRRSCDHEYIFLLWT